ncbi:hypothetical protein T439DRAFT_202826 [Meredithblackwellia eburnea MCA 4105]
MSGRRLYVGRLPQDATRKDVEAHFGAIGPVIDVRLMGGFCFLEYGELKVSQLFLVWLCPPSNYLRGVVIASLPPSRERASRGGRKQHRLT